MAQLTHNDVLNTPWSRQVDDGSDVASGPCRLMSITVTAATAGYVAVDNAATYSAAAIRVSAPAGVTKHVDFGPQGIYFDTGLSIVDAATGGYERAVTQYLPDA